MEIPQNTGVPEKFWKMILEIIESHLSSTDSVRVWLFGSRARGTFKKYSDVDLLLESDSDPATKLPEIRAELEESKIPYKIDLVSAAQIHPPYRSQIHSEKRLVATFPRG